MSKRTLGILSVIITFLVFGIFGFKWVHFRLTHSITNAVFVESESFVQLAYKRVAGRIAELMVREGQRVKKGQPLAKIDDMDYRIKLEEIRNQIKRLQRQKEALEIKKRTAERELSKRLDIVRLRLKQVQDKLAIMNLRKEKLRKDWERMKRLMEKGSIPQTKFEEIDVELKVLEKQLSSITMEKEALQKEEELIKIKIQGLEEITKNLFAIKNQIKALKTKEKDITRMVEETVLKSPIDGYVVKRFVDVGEVVRQGQYIYALYNPEDIYILALLEETKLEGVKEGNPVKIEIDAFPGKRFRGVVKEIGRSTAAKFAIIPRDITAGEFTKVAQRIPVKIDITEGDKSILRVGMGGEVAIEKR